MVFIFLINWTIFALIYGVAMGDVQTFYFIVREVEIKLLTL